MTGRDLARQLVGSKHVQCSALDSSHDRYDPITGNVLLSWRTMNHRDMWALMNAAHECAHRLQHQRGSWLLRCRSFTPIAVLIEWQAWAEAYRIARPYLKPADRADAWIMRFRALAYL